VPKNEYGFTPLISTVKQNHASLSPAFPIECSLFTASCRKIVQRRNWLPRGSRVWRSICANLKMRSKFAPCAADAANCEYRIRNRAGSGFRANTKKKTGSRLATRGPENLIPWSGKLLPLAWRNRNPSIQIIEFARTVVRMRVRHWLVPCRTEHRPIV